MHTSEVVRRAAAYLERHEVASPLADAETLLADVLGTDRSGLYRRTEGLSSAEAKLFGRALCRRCIGTPLQHITGLVGFRRLSLKVRAGVFIPRPETEIVAQIGLAAIADLAAPTVLDLCCGSGAIALAIADEHPGADVLALDRSPEAISLARANAAHLGLTVKFFSGDLWDGLPPERRGSLDLVITNPPYIEAIDVERVAVEVRSDPSDALVGGLSMHVRIISGAPAWLRAGGAFVTEIAEDQAYDVADLMRAAGFVDVTSHEDLNSRPRAVSGRKP